jgi:hypothetical protein
MRAKMTSKNRQITLPKSVAGAVRAKLAGLELNEKDIAGAVAWARKPARKAKK